MTLENPPTELEIVTEKLKIAEEKIKKLEKELIFATGRAQAAEEKLERFGIVQKPQSIAEKPKSGSGHIMEISKDGTITYS